MGAKQQVAAARRARAEQQHDDDAHDEDEPPPAPFGRLLRLPWQHLTWWWLRWRGDCLAEWRLTPRRLDARLGLDARRRLEWRS